MIDEEVRAIIDRAYERATEVLTTYRDRLDRLAEKLVAEETVDRREFEKLFERPAAEADAHAASRGSSPRARTAARRRPAAPARTRAPAGLTPAPPATHEGRTTRSALRCPDSAGPAVRAAIPEHHRRRRRRHPLRPDDRHVPAPKPCRSTSTSRPRWTRRARRGRRRCWSSRDPERLGLPEHAGRHAAAPPSGSPTGCATWGRPRSRSSTPALPPDRVREDPRGRGRADRARLLPLRRPAGRPGRAVGRRPLEPFLRDGRFVGRGVGRRQGPARCTSGARGDARRGPAAR